MGEDKASSACSVLVVDDQIGVRRLLMEVLKDEGYMVEAVPNGYEAIKKLKEFRPALVLLDMKMPGMNGLETLRKILKENPTQIVIMMTAYGELEVVNEAMRLGVKEYLTKPFDIDQLKMLINRALNK